MQHSELPLQNESQQEVSLDPVEEGQAEEH